MPCLLGLMFRTCRAYARLNSPNVFCLLLRENLLAPFSESSFFFPFVAYHSKSCSWDTLPLSALTCNYWLLCLQCRKLLRPSHRLPGSPTSETPCGHASPRTRFNHRSTIALKKGKCFFWHIIISRGLAAGKVSMVVVICIRMHHILHHTL